MVMVAFVAPFVVGGDCPGFLVCWWLPVPPCLLVVVLSSVGRSGGSSCLI